MQNTYFKKITNLFKSKLEIERDLATQHFYDKFKDDNVSPDIIDLILSYQKSGFKIDISDKKYIGKEIVNHKLNRQKDPFEYVWLSLINNSHKIMSKERNLVEYDVINTLLVVLKDMVSDNYKQYVKKGKSGLLSEFYRMHNSQYTYWPNYNVTQLIERGFVNVDIFREYLHTFELSTSLNNLTVLNNSLCRTKAEYLSKDEIQNFRNLKNELVENKSVLDKANKKPEKPKKQSDNNNVSQQLHFDINKLSQLYNKPSLANQVEKQDNLQGLTSLKKAVFKMNNKEDTIKTLSTNIFKSLDTIVSFNKLHNYKDHQHYINSLLTKHLPDIFDNYLELPDNYRTTAKDKNNPQQVFEEILTEIDKKLVSISEEIFQDNVTNLNIKKRFIKAI